MLHYAKWLSGFFYIFLSTIAMSAPVTVVYDFSSDVYAPDPIVPSLQLEGPVSGKLTIKYSDMEPEGRIDRLIMNFEQAPSISATGFVRINSNEYVATVKNAWIFRSVRVTLYTPDGFSNPDLIDIRLSVEYGESYIGSNIGGTEEGPILAQFPAELEAQSNFEAIDRYKTSFEGKTVILSLNKNLSRASSPSSYYVEEGIELKVKWFGHGEGSFFFPLPITDKIKPFAIQSDRDMIPPSDPESITVLYRENTEVMETPFLPLELILNEAIAPTIP